MEIIAENWKDPVETFQQALKNVMPVLEVKPRRVGGATYRCRWKFVPTGRFPGDALDHWQRQKPWKNGLFKEKLAGELMDAAQGVARRLRKKDDTHKMAEVNKAFCPLSVVSLNPTNCGGNNSWLGLLH